MSNEWEQGPDPETNPTGWAPNANQNSAPNNPMGSGWAPNQDDIDKRIEDIRRTLVQGANEAQQRLKRVVDKASTYWQQAQSAPPAPRVSGDIEEQHIRQLVNAWSAGNWRVAKDLGTYMDIVALGHDEVWEVTVQTRWESRAMEILSEPYTGRPLEKLQPLLPVWDYELPAVSGLKPPSTRTRLEGLDEILSCTACNGTGRALCSECTGRGWITCPDCRGRTKKRCPTCRGRGYIADWADQKKKPFFQRQAGKLAESVGGRVADVFEGIRQQGVPIPNPIDTDPANKGRTIPCPDCVNGEVDCDCVTGKRVCPSCQGAKTTLCSACGGTGKVVRYREMQRSFDLRTQSRVVGTDAIPEQQLQKADGELVYSDELQEALHPDAPPERVPADVWRVAVELARAATEQQGRANHDAVRSGSRATLQVLELVRIPYTRVDYRFVDQDYTLYIYDIEGREKFYAQRFPSRWMKIEGLVRAITNDLTQPAAQQPDNAPPLRGYRVPVEKPPYTITEDDDNL